MSPRQRSPHSKHGHGPTIGRRALPALALTGASGILLLALDHPAGSDASSTSVDTSASAVVLTPATTVSTVTTVVPGTSMPNPTTSVSAGPSVATTSAPTSTVPPAPAPAPSSQCGTVDGPSVQTKWGPVQVEASVAPDGTICAADAIVTPGGRSKSVRINDNAVPVLDQRAVEAQSATFQGVSGATITSNGYKKSLQAILDSVTA